MDIIPSILPTRYFQESGKREPRIRRLYELISSIFDDVRFSGGFYVHVARAISFKHCSLARLNGQRFVHKTKFVPVMRCLLAMRIT